MTFLNRDEILKEAEAVSKANGGVNKTKYLVVTSIGHFPCPTEGMVLGVIDRALEKGALPIIIEAT